MESCLMHAHLLKSTENKICRLCCVLLLYLASLMAVMTILGHLWNNHEIITFFSEPSVWCSFVVTCRREFCFSDFSLSLLAKMICSNSTMCCRGGGYSCLYAAWIIAWRSKAQCFNFIPPRVSMWILWWLNTSRWTRLPKCAGVPTELTGGSTPTWAPRATLRWSSPRRSKSFPSQRKKLLKRKR